MPNANAYRDGNRIGDSYIHPYGDSHCNCYSHCNCNFHSHGDSNSNSYGHSHTHGNSNSYGNANGNAQLHTGLGTGSEPPDACGARGWCLFPC